MNRRLSFSDEEAIPPPEEQPQLELNRIRTAPPVYSKIRAGSRDEFIRDINAYQAACIIHKTIDGVLDELPAEVPSYHATEFSNTSSRRSVGEAEIFRIRFLDVMTKLHAYMHEKRGLSDSVVSAMFIIALLVIVGGGVAWGAVIGSITIVAIVLLVGVIILGHLIYTIYRYYCKRKLFKAIDVAMAKVKKFERLDDKTVEHIKRGVLEAVPGTYWPTSQVVKTSPPPGYDEVVRQEIQEHSRENSIC